jgi:hypothetical protein
MFEISRDLEIKLMLNKDKMSPIIEEKISRLQDLAIKNKDQIESLALDFGMKINQVTMSVIRSNNTRNDDLIQSIDKPIG